MNAYGGKRKSRGKKARSPRRKSKSPRSRSRSRSASPQKKGILKGINKDYSQTGVKATTLGSLLNRKHDNVHTMFEDYKPLKDLSKYVSDSPFSPSAYVDKLRKDHRGTNIPNNVEIQHLMEKVKELRKQSSPVTVKDNWEEMKELNPVGQQFGGIFPGSTLSVFLDNIGSNTLSGATKRNLDQQRRLNNNTLHGSLDNMNARQVNDVLSNEYYVGQDTNYGMNPDKKMVAFTRMNTNQ